MATLLVGYDLNTPGHDYDRLTKALKAKGAYWHHLDSTWLVVTDQTVVQLRDELTPLIDSNDELLVLDVSGDLGAWYGFNERASEWLKSNL